MPANLAMASAESDMGRQSSSSQSPSGKIFAQAAPATPSGESQVKAHDATGEVKQKKRLMIYSGAYTLMVASVETSADKLVAEVEEQGGYLSGRQDNRLTLRVPAKHFFKLLERLPNYGRIIKRNLESQDVTRKVANLRLRISNARNTRERLVQLLTKTSKVSDVLKIESELRRLTNEIESMEAELRGLGDQIAYSTLVVSFRANAPESKSVHGRRYSRFEWINSVGMEAMNNAF